jgi:glyoxylase-like metal-dependent hydrolase (beta-lactamase superfamily II)
VVQISALPESAPVRLPDGVQLIRANNPGPLSLAGTNTWVLTGRHDSSTIVIDPGPPLAEHLAAIRAAGTPVAIVLTHRHPDHSEAAPELAAEFGVPIYAALPELASKTAPLVEADVIAHAGWELTVLATPGHTSDSVCLRIADDALFTGDTLLGGSTTIIAPPSGSLAKYFETMKRLAPLTNVRGLPGHGPAFSSVGEWAAHNAEYREERLAQLVDVYDRESQRGEASTLLGRVAAVTYGENGAPVATYIEEMTRAQLSFLTGRGDISGWPAAE